MEVMLGTNTLSSLASYKQKISAPNPIIFVYLCRCQQKWLVLCKEEALVLWTVGILPEVLPGEGPAPCFED